MINAFKRATFAFMLVAIVMFLIDVGIENLQKLFGFYVFFIFVLFVGFVAQFIVDKFRGR